MRARVQGIGGAILFAVSLALLAQEFDEGRERANALAVYGGTIGVAVAIGPLVGGAIVDGLGWEWVFFLNVPIGIAGLAVTYLKLRESRDPNATRIDWAGVSTFSVSLFLLVLALVRGNEEGWGSTPIVSLFGIAVALLVAFLVIESRVKEPMLPLHFFKRPAFTGVQVAAFALSGSMFALFLYLTLYLQNYLGHTPLEAGVRYLPITLAELLRRACRGGPDDAGPVEGADRRRAWPAPAPGWPGWLASAPRTSGPACSAACSWPAWASAC